ncbi:UNVERIFIED_CONTAM: hypothetical protein NCL1_14224 [Trichonephila clavipes]
MADIAGRFLPARKDYCLLPPSQKVSVNIVLLERQVPAFYVKMRVACILILSAVICLSVIQNNRANASIFKRSPIPADSDDSVGTGIRVERSPQNDDDNSTPQPTNDTDTTDSSSDDDDGDDDDDDTIVIVVDWDWWNWGLGFFR